LEALPKREDYTGGRASGERLLPDSGNEGKTRENEGNEIKTRENEGKRDKMFLVGFNLMLLRNYFFRGHFF